MGLTDKLISKSLDCAIDVAKAVGKKGGAALIAGAGVAVVAAAGYVAGAVHSDERVQEEKAVGYEQGIEKGAEMAADKMRADIVNPMLAQISVSYYIAWADGTISRRENKILDSYTDLLLKTPLPKPITNEINSITSLENIRFDDIKKYLDAVSTDKLQDLTEIIDKVAEASGGVSDQELEAISVFYNYVQDRTDSASEMIILKDDSEYIADINTENTIDDYFNNLITHEEISQEVKKYKLKMKALDYSFKRKTGLNSKDLSILVVATAMQIIRIYLVNKATEVELAGKGAKEDALHKKQKSLFERFKKDVVIDTNEYYFAPMEQIIGTFGVPYDAQCYSEENLKIFAGEKKGQGVDHRFATLGHDPIIGLFVGTINILTNTITTTKHLAFLPVTYHVKYDSGFKNPQIEKIPASLIDASKAAFERLKRDPASVAAALIKQLYHIATDVYTPAGIQLPGANLFFDRKVVEQLTLFISMGDAIKISADACLTGLINTLIELLYGCYAYEAGRDLNDKLQIVKAKKIILISDSIATGSNVVQTYITQNYKNLDIGGLAVLMSRLFNDLDFIYDIKYEFINAGLKDNDNLIIELEELDNSLKL